MWKGLGTQHWEMLKKRPVAEAGAWAGRWDAEERSSQICPCRRHFLFPVLPTKWNKKVFSSPSEVTGRDWVIGGC